MPALLECRDSRIVAQIRGEKTMSGGAVDFESIWNRQVIALDPPNRRGEGTSSAGIVEAAEWPEFGPHGRLYVKRQRAFFCRPAWNAFRSTPTLRREVRYLERARTLGLSVPTIVRYAEGSGGRAVLVLAEITGVTNLQQATEGAPASVRALIFENTGKMLVKLHAARVLHGAVYPKHVLVETAPPHRVWLIDFEKARGVMSPLRAAVPDLDRLVRHSPFMTNADAESLLAAYDGRRFERLHKRFERAQPNR
jgi:tRNA A-37 threonylcarbamoyl transferase component Bud32